MTCERCGEQDDLVDGMCFRCFMTQDYSTPVCPSTDGPPCRLCGDALGTTEDGICVFCFALSAVEGGR